MTAPLGQVHSVNTVAQRVEGTIEENSWTLTRSYSCANNKGVTYVNGTINDTSCRGGVKLRDVHVTVHRVKFLIIEPTRCTNFSNLLLEWNSTCFGQFLCSSSGVLHCTHSNGICHTRYADCLRAESGWSCSQIVSKPVWHIPLLCVQWRTPDDEERNYPKHVEFHSNNKFEKLVHLVGFIIRKCKVIPAHVRKY